MIEWWAASWPGGRRGRAGEWVIDWLSRKVCQPGPARAVPTHSVCQVCRHAIVDDEQGEKCRHVIVINQVCRPPAAAASSIVLDVCCAELPGCRSDWRQRDLMDFFAAFSRCSQSSIPVPSLYCSFHAAIRFIATRQSVSVLSRTPATARQTLAAATDETFLHMTDFAIFQT